ncbi:tyramine oxidase subunit B [Ethanoligenens sp.]|uniref:tyramine oxidase subunit B n=1 Tax=Ethanoligenens sp. TaxID=2099655 RepID=UPI0039E7A991
MNDTGRIEFLYLSEEDMVAAGVKDMAKCVDVMEKVVKLLNVGDYMMSGNNHNSHGAMVSFPDEPEFPNMPKNGCDRRFMAMPAYLGGEFDMAGVKWYGSNIENKGKNLPRSILMLILSDKETGAPVAMMSANLISAYRTGAFPGVGARYLARKDAKVAGIVGPGVMGKTALRSFTCVCPQLDTVKVKGRGKKSLDAFMRFVREECPTIQNVEVVDTVEAAVRDSDIVCVATSSPVDVADYTFIEEKWIKKGALFCLPATVNFDDDFLAYRCTKVVDNFKLYKAWAEEYPYPTFGPITIIGSKFTDLIHEKKIASSQVIDLGDIINGRKPGRQSDDEIILYSVGGMPVEDIAWGKVVYENALRKGIGQKLCLWNKPEMV